MHHILYIITRSDDIGGAQIHVRDMALYSLSKGFKVSVIVGGNGIYIDHLKKNGISVYPINNLRREINLQNDLKVFPKMLKLIKKISPDLISLHSSKVGIIVRTLRIIFKLPPCIFTAHGWSFSSKVSKFRSNIFLFLEKLMMYGTSTLITICKSDYDLAIKNSFIHKKKIKLIHNGMPFLKSPKRSIKPIHHKFKLISVARFEFQKDHETLIKALSYLKSLSWELFLVGEGPLKNNIKILVKQFEMDHRVNFLGRRTDVANLLNQCDIFILSSLWEGFPRSILEALRASMPVITSRVGGVAESVIDKHNGYIVPLKDYKSLAFAIEKLLKNPQKCLDFGLNGRRIYENNFVFDNMAKKTFNIYLELLNN